VSGARAAGGTRRALWALFLVSLAAVGYETALTRYFAVAKWSEYGYWVISIVMAGFALSGVVLALARDAFARRGPLLLAVLPPLLVATAAIGFRLTTTNPFNPLQLQNPATWQPQLWNIAGYYAALLPFFFLTGLFVSLCFVLHDRIVPRVYAFDLTGAGAGALAVLVLMFVLHPFMLVPALLVPLAGSALFAPRLRTASVLATLLALAGGEALLIGDNQATFNDFKAIYAPLHTPDAKVLAEIRSPRGDYMLLDDFTERVDTDVSNNAGMLGVAGPPTTFGLYRDGNRVASMPRPGKLDLGYAAAGLDALPYALIPHANVLVAGASGGFRAMAPLSLGAAHVDALEPEPVLRAAVRDGLGGALGGAPALPADPRLRLLAESPLAAAQPGALSGARYDIVDISADFLDAAEANASAFTTEALAADLRALTPGGIVSVPVSIRDFPVYALRLLATAREALRETGAADPSAQVIAYRSAWNVRVLLSPTPWDAARIAAIRKWCDDRSFDVAYYPGMDPVAARANIYNDLPAVSFARGEISSDGPDDAIADEARAVLDGMATQSGAEFNLEPVTLDRPFFYAVLRLSHLSTLLKRVEVLPTPEIGALVNLAVLAQAVVLALLVLAVPLVAPGRIRPLGARAGARAGVAKAALYFPALGLGFLFIEIAAIEKASLYLADRTTAFALVLTGMLVFSGLGSLLAGRAEAFARRSVGLAALVVVAWCGAMVAGLTPALLASLGWPIALRIALVLLLIAPVSVALGTFFPLGLAQAGPTGFLPWAWGLNGAFSVVATPAANLLAREAGFDRVLMAAALLYVVAALAFPLARKNESWLRAPSHAAD
jgi:hypothetical protein